MTIGRILLVLLAIWVVLALIGLLVKTLFWLFVIALVLFGFTLAGGMKNNRFSRR
ncbi:MAG: hypothetical protein ABI345_08850 [Jatrophihabitans sp.]